MVRPCASSLHRWIAMLITLACIGGLLPADARAGVAVGSEGPHEWSSMQAGQHGLVAMRHQGNLWLMREDGSDLQQVTDYDEGVSNFAWSPSGRYLVIEQGGSWNYEQLIDRSRSSEQLPGRINLYDVTTGELRTLLDDRSALQGRFPNWAVDADALMMEVVEQGGNYSLVRIDFDGTTTPVVTYHHPPLCGGMDGPMSLYRDLYHMQELGWSPAQWELGQILWWEAGETAYVNHECFQAISVDLDTATVTEHASGRWAGALADGRIMLAPIHQFAQEVAGVFDPRSGAIARMPTGEQYAAGPGGEIFYTTVTEDGPSDFTFRFDDFPAPYADQDVSVWRIDDDGSEPRLVATLDAYATGIPAVTADGSALIVAAIDNPTALMDVDISGYDAYASDIFAEHQKIIRIEIDSGDVTVLATRAQRPRLQPQPADAPDDASPGAEEPGEATPIVAESADGLIAFTGEDGNIWLGTPDGGTVWPVTTDGSPERPYINPNWSPDGTMLVFSTRYAQEEWWNDIYLLRDGRVTRIPTIHNCSSAAFTADSTRLALLCATARSANPDQGSLNRRPEEGFVSVVDLDGATWEVLTPFVLEVDGQRTLDWTMLTMHDISVSPVDGAILVNTIFWSSSRSHQIRLIDSSGAWDASINRPEGTTGRIWGRFSADGETLLVRNCGGCYNSSTGPPDSSVLLMDRDGTVLDTIYAPEPDVLIGGYAQSPDGNWLLLSSTTEERDLDFGTPGVRYRSQLIDLGTGNVTNVPINGGAFAWQPAAVEITLPGSTDGLQPTTPFILPPILAVNCTTTREGIDLLRVEPVLPDGCTMAEGVTVTITGEDGQLYGSCTTQATGSCVAEIWAPVDTGLIANVDPDSIPDGYEIVDGMTQSFTIPSQVMNTDTWALQIVSMPAGMIEAPAPEEPGDGNETGSAWPGVEPGGNWIAYIGGDGNIRLMQPDGSQQAQVTTDGDPSRPYYSPVWSHDGAMLAFSGYSSAAQVAGIWLLRGGAVRHLSGTESCGAAAFSADNQRLLFGCAQTPEQGAPPPADLVTNPARGVVSSSNLDGTDQQVVIPYTLDGAGVPWISDGKSIRTTTAIDVDPASGMILVTYGGFRKAGVYLFDADGVVLSEFDMVGPLGHGLGPWEARFTPDGTRILATWCSAGCYPNAGNLPVGNAVILDLTGNIIQNWTFTFPGRTIAGADISPDGRQIVLSYADNSGGRNINLLSGPYLQEEVVPGTDPAWQPDPAIDLAGWDGPAARIADFLPETAELPGAFTMSDEGKRDQDAITSTFPNPAEASANFDAWEWKGCVYRIYTPVDGASGPMDGIVSIDVSVHRFGSHEGASAAMAYYANARQAGLGLTSLQSWGIGDESLVIGGEVSGQFEATVYTRRGSALIRVTVTSTVAIPQSEALSVGEIVLGK